MRERISKGSRTLVRCSCICLPANDCNGRDISVLLASATLPSLFPVQLVKEFLRDFRARARGRGFRPDENARTRGTYSHRRRQIGIFRRDDKFRKIRILSREKFLNPPRARARASPGRSFPRGYPRLLYTGENNREGKAKCGVVSGGEGAGMETDALVCLSLVVSSRDRCFSNNSAF